MKTYRTSDAETYFKHERTAFSRLRYNGGPHANIIGYYCSFILDGTYNIILEYADRGTLDEYMEATPAPKNVSEIMTFWDRFFAVMQGLVHIHGTLGSDPEEQKILLGYVVLQVFSPQSLITDPSWHQDLTPENILVVSKNKNSPYDCDFKIADFGLAHFKQYQSSLHNATDATDNDVYGTNAYG